MSLPADFLLLMDASGRILPIRPGAGVAPPTTCITLETPKPADGAAAVSMATFTSDFQKFSPFSPLKGEGPDPAGAEPGPFLPPRLRGGGGGSPGPNGAAGLGEYGSFYAPGPDYYSGLAKDPSLESQDSSTLSSPPSDCLAPPPPGGASGGPAPPDSLFQFSIGQILEEEPAAAAGGHGAVTAPPPGQEADRCELPGFYEAVAYSESSASEGAAAAAPLPTERADVAGDPRPVRR